jgi:hypothetical protein
MTRSMKWTVLPLLFGGSLFAQELTPLQFKQLCENSPMNTFTLTAPTKILGTAPVVTTIDTACRINFATGSKLEADQSAFAFAGPLVFQAGPNAEVALVKSFFEAPSVQITEGISSSLILSESSVKANAGNITIALGANGKVDASMPYALLRNALEAAGSISISGGARATFSLQSTDAVAGASINLNFAGTEGTLALQDSLVTAAGGPFAVISTGTFANFDVSSSTINAASGILLSARGREGKVNLSTVGMNAGLGSVQVDAGVGANRSGVVKIVSGNIVSGGAVTILASRNSTLGEAVLEVSTVTANGDVRVESGSGGTTTVLNNGITSPSLIRVFAPVNGSCVAENNRAIAPTLRLCR